MTGEQARELFSEAYEGDLDAERKEAFEQALGADEALRTEYEQFCDMLRATSRLALQDGDAEPDLLAGVQRKLRARSRGRYYRDRFSERASIRWPLPAILGALMLAVMLIAWVMLQKAVLVTPAASTHEGIRTKVHPPR